MFLQWLWISMMICSLIYALMTGNGSGMLQEALQGSTDAISLTLQLGAGYLFFCGMMEIVRGTGMQQRITGVLQPLIRRLMPNAGSAAETVAMNLSMNVLGLGNAATPVGMEAMRLMDEERKRSPSVKHDMYMLLILNATSLQLMPTTVLTLRVAAGSADPNMILLPTLACTALSTAVGAGLGMCMRKYEERKPKWL